MFKFSLILPTLGQRPKQLKSFLNSLCEQDGEGELIVVDQSPDGCVKDQIKNFKGQFEIVYLNAKPGLSAARNLALSRSHGDIVGFPDDDCEYSKGMLKNVTNCFAEFRADIVVGVPVDFSGIPLLCRPGSAVGEVHKKSLLLYSMSIGIFARRSLLERLGGFDEVLGLGSKQMTQGAEEADLLFRAFDSGAAIRFDNDIQPYHPKIEASIDWHKRKERHFKFAYSHGYIFRKNNFPIGFLVRCCLRSFIGAWILLAAFRWKDSFLCLLRIQGLGRGWLSYPRF